MSTVTAATPRRIVHERIATFGVFVAFGLVLGTWAAHLPAVKQAIGASSSSMGTILLILGAGAFVGMQISGVVVDRWGGGRVAIFGALAMAIAVVPPLILTTWLSVAIAALGLGLAIGVSEVGMNAVAVEVERGYGRPIMASFHGMFSVGSVLGALAGAIAFASGVGTLTTAVAVAGLALTVCAAAAPTLLRRDPPPAPAGMHQQDEGTTNSSRPHSRWRVAAFGAMAFLLLLTEGCAMDWSNLHAQQHLGASATAGALALASFVAAMTLGRFTVDRVASRVGPVKVLRWGSLLSVGGLVVVTQAPMLPVTCLGWVLLGIGLSGCVPQVFTATGNIPGATAKSLSQVVGAGYLAVLAGPAVFGWLADLITLNGALSLPIAAMLICACSAPALTTTVHTARL